MVVCRTQEREKEGLLEQVAGLESAAADNVKLGEKITELEGQVKKKVFLSRFGHLCLTIPWSRASAS